MRSFRILAVEAECALLARRYALWGAFLIFCVLAYTLGCLISPNRGGMTLNIVEG